ncbi:hypothetical protein BJF82_09250 [Kytococcus sp. CUA-901]|nr:hypothetical protein BJF82_09250 [Kytococcus sp. CUA-901]
MVAGDSVGLSRPHQQPEGRGALHRLVDRSQVGLGQPVPTQSGVHQRQRAVPQGAQVIQL